MYKPNYGAMNKEHFTSRSPEETYRHFRKIGENARKGDIFALYGNLGAGKTLIAKSIAEGMGITDDITSPTFTLLEIYDGEIPLYHFDLYRIEDERELDNLFFEEYWNGNGVSIVEWADNAKERLDDATYKIYIEYIDENSREITIEYFNL